MAAPKIRRLGFTDNFPAGGYKPAYGYRDAPLRQTQYAPPGYLDSPLRGQLAQAPAAPKVQTIAPPVAPAKPVTPQQPAAAQPAAAPAFDDPDIVSDPVLMKARKLYDTRKGDARASAVARKKQLAIETGDIGLAREFGLDESTGLAASQNPLSAFALAREESRREQDDFSRQLDPSLLFSGFRGTALGQLAQNALAREANAASSARERFSGIESELLGELGSADELTMSAEADAYARAVERRRAGIGGIGGAADGGGAPGAGVGGAPGGGVPGPLDRPLPPQLAPPFGSLMLDGGGLAPGGFVRAEQQDDPSLRAMVPPLLNEFMPSSGSAGSAPGGGRLGSDRLLRMLLGLD